MIWAARATERAVYTSEAETEMIRLRGFSVAGCLVDLTKTFDHFGCKSVISAAIRRGFPAVCVFSPFGWRSVSDAFGSPEDRFIRA